MVRSSKWQGHQALNLEISSSNLIRITSCESNQAWLIDSRKGVERGNWQSPTKKLANQAKRAGTNRNWKGTYVSVPPGTNSNLMMWKSYSRTDWLRVAVAASDWHQRKRIIWGMVNRRRVSLSLANKSNLQFICYGGWIVQVRKQRKAHAGG